MNLQQVFDKAWIGLKAQGFERCMSDLGCGEVCAYRQHSSASNRIRCGIGHAIPDELYSVDFEGMGIEMILEPPVYPLDALYNDKPYQLLREHFEGVPSGVLNELQNCHDIDADPVIMERRLRGFAQENNLLIEGLPA